MKPFLVNADESYSHEQYFVMAESDSQAISKMQMRIINTQGKQYYNRFYAKKNWSAVELVDYAIISVY